MLLRNVLRENTKNKDKNILYIVYRKCITSSPVLFSGYKQKIKVVELCTKLTAGKQLHLAMFHAGPIILVY